MEHGRWHFTSAQFESGASPSEWKMWDFAIDTEGLVGSGRMV
jgi:hypothetical protein